MRPGFRGGDDSHGDRMLRLAFNRCRKAQGGCLVAILQQNQIADAEPALGQCACLVKDHGIQIPRTLEGRTVANEQVPLRAASDVETATTSGTARPSACGQAMTMTVTIRSSAKVAPAPTAYQ